MRAGALCIEDIVWQKVIRVCGRGVFSRHQKNLETG
jgi:hypothetical protein